MKRVATSIILLLIIVSCKEADPGFPIEISRPTSELHYDSSFQFKIFQGPKDFLASDYDWESSDPKVGTIDATGIFKARKIGRTTIIATSSRGLGNPTTEVVVTPYSLMCKEAFLGFGASEDRMPIEENRKLISKSATSYLYEGENPNVRYVMYLFKDGKLTSSVLLLKTDSETIEESATFLKERYTMLGSTNNTFFFTDGSKVSLAISVDATLGLNILYLPYDPNKRVSAESPDLKELYDLSRKALRGMTSK